MGLFKQNVEQSIKLIAKGIMIVQSCDPIRMIIENAMRGLDWACGSILCDIHR